MYQHFFKRFFDIVCALLALIVFCWLYAIIAIIVQVKLGSPVLFKQTRVGKNGRIFKIYKFRSMCNDAEALKKKLMAQNEVKDGAMFKMKDDPRVTRVGKFIRKTSIDELPQFINILRGDMSIIGPRPHMLYHTDVYSELISNYMVRHLAKPGLTGWAQINGCRGETKTNEDMRKRVELDIWYIEHWSPWLDLVIFIKTINQLVFHKDKQAY